MAVNFTFDEDGNAAPEFFVPHHWSANYFSGLGFRSRTITEQGKISVFANSRVGTFSQDQRVLLNLLTYQSGGEGTEYTAGGSLERIDIDKFQFGFFELPEALGGDLVAFDNTIEIAVTRIKLLGDATWKFFSESLFLRLGAELSPVSQLEVKQRTRFQPIVAETGKSSSSSAQDLAYGVRFDSMVKIEGLMGIGLTAFYEFLPLSYELVILGVEDNQFVFVPADIEVEEITTRIALRFVSDLAATGDMHPYIGFGSETLVSKDVKNGGESTETRGLLLVGIENQF